jgi:hypothetical protein
MLRKVALALLALEIAAWLAFVVTILLTDSVPRSEGKPMLAAFIWIPSAILLLFGLPALVLAWKNKMVVLAFGLALLALTLMILLV